MRHQGLLCAVCMFVLQLGGIATAVAEERAEILREFPPAYYSQESSVPRLFTEFKGEVYFAAYIRSVSGLYKMNAAGEIILVKDVTLSGKEPGRLCYVSAIAVVGDKIYFSSEDTQSTFETASEAIIWRTDGTEAGTTQIATLPERSVVELVRVGQRVFVSALADDRSNQELWVCDGTASGTRKVFGPVATNGFTTSGIFLELTAYNNALYFWVLNRTCLYKSDGTPEGTLSIFFGNTGYGGMAVWNNMLYFPHYGGVSKTDGTIEGTTLAISKGISGDLIKANGKLYFFAPDGIWKSDTTESGTVLFCPLPHNDFIYHLKYFDGKIFYVLNEGYMKYGIYCANGATKKTQRLATTSQWQVQFTEYNDVLFFVTHESYGANGRLMCSDGTVKGTQAFDFVPDAEEQVYQLMPTSLGLCIMADDQAHGYELWTSDGTLAGTRLRDLAPPRGVYSVSEFPVGENVAIRHWKQGVPGYSLYISDGAGFGTHLIKDNAEYAMTVLNGNTLLFFATNEAGHGQLWKSDLDGKNQQVVKTISTTPETFYVPGWSWSENLLMFFVDDGVHGQELWRTDGTTEGTYLVKDINPGAEGSLEYGDVEMFYDRLYFSADDGVDGSDLWTSDGTESGTVKLMDGPSDSIGTGYAPFNGKVVFWREYYGLAEEIIELCMTDGTVAGTSILATYSSKDYTSTSSFNYASASGFHVIGDQFYYSLCGRLFRSDGTASGTELTKTFAKPGPMIAFKNSLYVFGDLQLWKSDGTASGTEVFADLAPRESRNGAHFGLVAGDTLYFSASDGVHGLEPWRTDGTSAGTKMVQDIEPGPYGSNPASYSYDWAFAGGRIHFTATTEEKGTQPYVYPAVVPMASETKTVAAGGSAPISFSGESADVEFLSNSNSGDLTVEYYDWPGPFLEGSLHRSWVMKGMEGSEFGAILTFRYSDELVPGGAASEAGLRLMRSNDWCATWQEVPAVVDTEANTVRTVAPQGTLSVWALTTVKRETAVKVWKYE